MQNIIVSLVVGAAIGYAVAAIYKGIKKLISNRGKDGECDSCEGCDNDGCCGK